VKIADINVEPNLVLAPMAGVTSSPFRLLCRKYGAGMSSSELVSSAALIMGGEKSQEKSRQLAWFCEEERPVAVQIFGSDPVMMREAAVMMAAAKPDAIDINMGCSVRKIAKCGAGCLLMKTPEKAAEIIAATVAGAAQYGVPVTVKMRAGWDHDNINAPEVAKRAQDAGAVAVAVHPRTATQAYEGLSDWSVIRKVKESVQIPVIGSGDVMDGPDAKRMLDETGCDAVMLGRAALGNPFLFADVGQYLKDGGHADPPSPEVKTQTALWHAQELVNLKGEKTAISEMRKHAAWYTKGLPESARLRESLVRVNTLQELETVLAECLEVCQEYASLN
jgi:nifR3 family TIM-barrel protein